MRSGLLSIAGKPKAGAIPAHGVHDGASHFDLRPRAETIKALCQPDFAKLVVEAYTRAPERML